MGKATLAAVGWLLLAPAEQPSGEASETGTDAYAGGVAAPTWPLVQGSRYLTRPVARSARYLDHGVIAVAVAGGYPHRYRLGLALGLFDHATVGVTTRWLPGERAPRWSPVVALALFRGERVDVGVHYFQVLHAAFPRERAPAAHWLLAAATFSHRWVSGGFDVGAVHARVPDPALPPDRAVRAPVGQWRLGGGLHFRAGTRRWGWIAQAFAPHWMVELAFEVRLGAFEQRPRGEWAPSGHSWAGDRGRPRRH